MIDVATGSSLIAPEKGNVFLASFSLPTSFDGKTYVALSTDNTRFATSELESWIGLWSLDPVELVGVVDDDDAGFSFIYPSFSPDGRFLGIGTNGPTAIVVDVEEMANGATEDEYIVFNQEVHSGNTPRVIPTADGLLATGSFDGFYRLWDLETGQRLFEIEVGEALARLGHGFGSDGSTLYYVQSANAIGRLPTDVNQMIVLATDSMTRTLTDDECRDYLHKDGC